MKSRHDVCSNSTASPAIGLGISTVQGGNVVTMGEGVRRKLAELKRDQPIGIEIGEINFQPEAVTKPPTPSRSTWSRRSLSSSWCF